MRWQALNLCSSDYASKTQPPDYCGLIYRARRHYLTGPPESAKTLVAAIVALDVIRTSATRGIRVDVAWIDFEMGPYAFRELLDNLGATSDELERFLYFEPDCPPEADDLQSIIGNGASLAVIDSAAGAYEITGLDDNSRRDAQKFARQWIDPLWRNGVTTLTIDHVVKNSENRGKWAIGSERKIGAVDVHLGLDAVRPLARGSDGLVTVTVHRDRQGWLKRGQVAELELHSAPDTHQIAYTFRAPSGKTDEGWRPTVLMEKVSRFLETQSDPVSRNAVEKAVRGKRAEFVRRAIDALVTDGYVDEISTSTARLLKSLKQFRDPSSEGSSDFVPVRPDEVEPHFVPSSPPTGGTRTRDEVADERAASEGQGWPIDEQIPVGDEPSFESEVGELAPLPSRVVGA